MNFAREAVPILIFMIVMHLVFYLAFWIAGRMASPLWITYSFSGIALLFALLTLFSLYFFRDPERSGPAVDDIAISPADGRILTVETVNEPDFIRGEAQRISIFMNVFDVHVNRAPVAGTVRYKNYRPGKFFNASLDKASIHNEAMTIGIDSPDWGRVLVRQIAGLIARRIVCRVGNDTHLEKGERFGMIKFGSRVELFLPVSCEILVKPGDRVFAGKSEMARLK